jgi:hypothetical protein
MSTWIAVKLEDGASADDFFKGRIGERMSNIVTGFKKLIPGQEIGVFTDDLKSNDVRSLLSSSGLKDVQVMTFTDGEGSSSSRIADSGDRRIQPGAGGLELDQPSRTDYL